MSTEYDLSESELIDSFSFAGGRHHFPYEIDMGGVYYCGSAYFTRRDRFSYSILLYTISGCGAYEYRGKCGILQEGTLLLDSRYPHCYRTADGMSWKFIWMHYIDQGDCSLADYFFETGMEVLQIPKEEMKGMYGRIKEISCGAESLPELRAAQEFLQFIGNWGMYNFKSAYPIIREYGETVTRAQIYIHENYKRRITLKELARVCTVDQYHLIRLFGRYLGITPHQYLLRVRIGKAKLLLVSTDKTVSQIGRETGFEDDSTFISAFGKITGTTPLKYRKADK